MGFESDTEREAAVCGLSAEPAAATPGSDVPASCSRAHTHRHLPGALCVRQVPFLS